jgi:hypothetical protein
MNGGEREYTAENLAVVERVRACKVTEYYEILAVKRECDEADVKKAYRKVSYSVIRFDDVRPTSLGHIVGARITPRQKCCAWG